VTANPNKEKRKAKFEEKSSLQTSWVESFMKKDSLNWHYDQFFFYNYWFGRSEKER
jgi:hypothetical protein